ncbi:MAG TPA: ester cyclase [Chloroflexota bacterium]
MQCDYASHKAVVLRWAELFSTGDPTTATEVFACDLHDHRFPPIGDIEGIEGETRFIASIRTAFPDLRVEIEDMVAEGDRVAARVTHRGTHGGSFLGVPPTGRLVTYEGTVIFRIADGRIADRWGTVDLFGILLQLGVTTTVLIPAHPEVGSA